MFLTFLINILLQSEIFQRPFEPIFYLYKDIRVLWRYHLGGGLFIYLDIFYLRFIQLLQTELIFGEILYLS